MTYVSTATTDKLLFIFDEIRLRFVQNFSQLPPAALQAKLTRSREKPGPRKDLETVNTRQRNRYSYLEPYLLKEHTRERRRKNI